MELTLDQIVLVGVIASLVTQVLKIISERLGYSPSREVANITLFVASLVLGFFWMRPEVPVSGDPMELAQVLLTAALGLVGFASLIYNLLLEKVVFPRVRLA